MATVSLERALEGMLRRDRVLVVWGIAIVSALAWAYMVFLAQGMGGAHTGPSMAMPHAATWGLADFALTFAMWAVMMVAMMVPSAGPLILLVATVNRKRRELASPLVPTGVFLLGYVAAWTWYSALATVGQWGLHEAALLSPMMGGASPAVGGAILLAAGVFQFTPLKYACLTRCRSPLQFLLNEWREGTWGAFAMGLRNGNTCVVCCWALMALMFVGGVMSLLWMAAIAAVVLIEKVAPAGHRVSQAAGGGLILWGAWLLAQTAS
jgi:predicted metal-binding membrane protein